MKPEEESLAVGPELVEQLPVEPQPDLRSLPE